MKGIVFFLCAGGCSDDISPVLRLVSSLIKAIGILGAALFVVIALYYVLIWILSANKRKNMSGKSLVKKVLKYLIIAVVIYLVSILLNLALGLVLANGKDFDLGAQCWCS